MQLVWVGRRGVKVAVADGEKWCSRCAQAKPLDEFWNNVRSHDGKQAYCKSCLYTPQENRRRTYVRYGITKSEYDAMVQKQNGRCAICKRQPTDCGGRSRDHLHIDHDKATGKVRGLLCTSCNTGLGRFDHDEQRLLAAADYITITQS